MHIRDHTTRRHHLCRGCGRKVARGQDDATTLVCHCWSRRASQCRDTPKSPVAWTTLTARGGRRHSRKARHHRGQPQPHLGSIYLKGRLAESTCIDYQHRTRHRAPTRIRTHEPSSRKGETTTTTPTVHLASKRRPHPWPPSACQGTADRCKRSRPIDDRRADQRRRPAPRRPTPEREAPRHPRRTHASERGSRATAGAGKGRPQRI